MTGFTPNGISSLVTMATLLPVRPGPLVERGRPRGAVLAAQPARAGHVVVGHHRGLHGLQGLIGGVPPEGQRQRGGGGSLVTLWLEDRN